MGVGTIRIRYVVRFPDRPSARLAREKPEWLEGGTKQVTPRFRVVFRRIPTEEVIADEN